MNYISCDELNIVIDTKKSIQATYLAFMNKLFECQPQTPMQIYSYMTKEYFPSETRKKKRHILAPDEPSLVFGRDEPLDPSFYKKLDNGWLLVLNNNGYQYANNYLARVEEATGYKITAMFEKGGKNVYGERHGAHRNVTRTEHDAILRSYNKSNGAAPTGLNYCILKTENHQDADLADSPFGPYESYEEAIQIADSMYNLPENMNPDQTHHFYDFIVHEMTR